MNGKGIKEKKGKTELKKHFMMISVGVFFFKFTKLGLMNKILFSLSK